MIFLMVSASGRNLGNQTRGQLIARLTDSGVTMRNTAVRRLFRVVRQRSAGRSDAAFRSRFELPGTGPESRHLVAGVVQAATAKGEATAADAAGEPVTQPLKGVDPGVQFVLPAFRKARPVGLGRRVVVRKCGERLADVLQ